MNQPATIRTSRAEIFGDDGGRDERPSEMDQILIRNLEVLVQESLGDYAFPAVAASDQKRKRRKIDRGVRDEGCSSTATPVRKHPILQSPVKDLAAQGQRSIPSNFQLTSTHLRFP